MGKQLKSFLRIGDFVCFYIEYNFNGNIRYGTLIKLYKNGLCAIETPNSRICIEQKYVFKSKADLMAYVKKQKEARDE